MYRGTTFSLQGGMVEEAARRNLPWVWTHGRSCALIETMARGWESKSVEDQQSLAAEAKPATTTALTPEEQQRRQQIDVLRLALQSTQRTLAAATSERHREQLAAAVAELERKIAALQSAS